MKRLTHLVMAVCLLCIGHLSFGQSMGIGTETPNQNSVLHLVSPNNNQGLLIPQLTTAQRTASDFTSRLTTTDNGLMVFDVDENAFYYWHDNSWQSLRTSVSISAGSGISLVDGQISNTGDLDETNELQSLSLTGTNISISNGNTIDLSSLDTNTQLDEAAVDAFVSNNGYLTSVDLSGYDNDSSDDFDGDYSSLANAPTNLSEFTNDSGFITSPNDSDADETNELITNISLETGNILRITDAGGNNDIDLSSLQDGTGTDNQNLTFDGTNLNISNGTGLDISSWDTDSSDDFDGAYSSLTGSPSNLSDFTNDSGYVTTSDDADADPTNELISAASLSGTTLRITDAGGNNDIDLSSLQDGTGTDSQNISFDGTNLNISGGTGIDISNWDTDSSNDFDGDYTSLSNVPTNLSDFTNDVGYITSADDADADNSNELITSALLTGTTLRISDAGGNNDVDLSSLQDGTGTDDQIASEVPVTPASGVTSTTVQAALEELQSEIAAGGGGDMLEAIYDGDGDNTVDNSELVNGLTVETAVPSGAVFTDTQLDETAVDSYVSNNGYLTSSDLTGYDSDASDDFDGNYSSLTGAPTNVSSLTNDAGYITSADDADANASNELITAASLIGTTLRITDAGGNNDVNLSSLQDGTGTDSQNITFDGTNLNISGGTGINISGWDTDDSDDFDGNYSSLTGAPTNVSSFTNDAGYVTSADDADANASNELITAASLIGTTLRITDAGGNNDIDLSSLQDGTGSDDQSAIEVSVTPANGVTSINVQAALEELQSEIAASGGGDMLESIYDNDSDNIVDNSELVNGLTVETAVPSGAVFTDTQLDESTVDTYVSNNGFLTATNLTGYDSDASDDFDGNYSSLIGAPTNVSSFTNDAGYITSADDADANASNELITAASLIGTTLRITDAGGNNDVNLSSLQDGTGTDSQNITFDGTNLNISGGTGIDISGWDTDDSDDFSFPTSTEIINATPLLDLTNGGQGQAATFSSASDTEETVYITGTGSNLNGSATLIVNRRNSGTPTSFPTDIAEFQYLDNKIVGIDEEGFHFASSGVYPATIAVDNSTGAGRHLVLQSGYGNSSGGNIRLEAGTDGFGTRGNVVFQASTFAMGRNEIDDDGAIRFEEEFINGTNFVAFQAPANIASNISWILPSSEGSAGSALTTDGTGNLSWSTIDSDNSNELLTSGGMSGNTLRLFEGSNNVNVDLSQFEELPEQTGNSGSFLTTDGSAVSWATIPSSPWNTSGSNINFTGGIVGVGTSSPSTSYQMEIETSLSRGLFVDNNYVGVNNTYGLLYTAPPSATGSNWGFYSSGEDYNYFSGNVGIGTTTPSTKLTVFKNESGATNPMISVLEAGGSDASINLSSQGSNEFTFGIDATNGYFKISDSNVLGTTDRLTIDAGGRIGIGTSTPLSNYQTEIESTDYNGAMYIDNNYTGTSTSYGIVYSIVNTGTGTKYGFYSTGEDRNYFSGNVGIGTTAPSAKLDVVGDVELNGNLISKASGIYNVNFAPGGILPKPTRRVQRIRNTGSTVADLQGIEAGDDGQELILISVEEELEVGTGGAPTLNDGDGFQIRILGPPTNEWGVNAEDSKLYLSSYSFTMYGGSTIHLIYDAQVGAWIEISRSQNLEYAALN